MFRTSKILAAGILASLSCTPALAQSDILTRMNAGEPTAPAGAKEELRDAIRQKILNLASGVSAAPDSNVDALTINEIDALNRSAERSKTRLELEKIELDRMRTELEGLLAVYEAMSVLEEEEETNDRPVVQQQMADTNQPNTPPTPTPLEIERDQLPRLGVIAGAAGNFEAGLIFPDGSQSYAAKGDFIDGFEVVDVTSSFIVLKGQMTGTQYRMMPKGQPDARDTQGQGTPQQAIDLQSMPFGIF